jgi:adenylylsulfate kinase-like enzyme
MPVLWLCGPPGVGKTAVGWEIYWQLVRSGVDAAYVDIDQLGICYPEAPADPGRHRLKARNLDHVVRGYQAHGVRCVVVSGVVDPDRGVEVTELAEFDLTVCRLRADRDSLARRFTGRSVGGDAAAALRDADRLDVSGVAGNRIIDTSNLSVVGAAGRVRELAGGWPPLHDGSVVSSAGSTPDRPMATDGSILFLCGAVGVGKSTAGFLAFQKILGSGVKAGYLDIDQIGFCGRGGRDHRLRARNLAAIWQSYRATGAERLIAVGPVEDDGAAQTYEEALPAVEFVWLRLHADVDQLRARITQRGERGSWPQPGDPLIGQSREHLLAVAERAGLEGEELDRRALGVRIDTSELTVEQVADAILSRSGWVG